jgi:hypothetical protein
MNALIGDRFLKRFIGRRRRLPGYTADPVGEALTSPEPTAEKPAEAGCPTVEDLPKGEATPEAKQEVEAV